MTLVGGGSRTKSGHPKTWWEAEVGGGRATRPYFPLSTSALSPAPSSNCLVVCLLSAPWLDTG